jgi:CSLREA domain-containing protein
MRTGRLQTGVILVLTMVAVARPATITVNSTADSLATNGNCTLREAILAANSDTAVDGCAAGSGPDVVVLPAGTYALTGEAGEDAGLTGDLDVTDDLELVGAGAETLPGAGTRITPPIRISPPPCGPFGCSFAQTDRIFDIDPAGAGISVRLSGISLGTVFLEGTTIDEGGAIRNRGTLAVADSMVGSRAVLRGGGIFSIGPLRVERSDIRGGASSGAGISALGPLEVVDSTIRYASGDGIGAAGPVTLMSSTVSSSTGNGVIVAGSATLVNSTVSGNTGGGVVADGLVELSNVTVTDNHGGGVTAGSIVLRNTIVAGNIPTDCIVGSTTGDAYNIDGDGSCGLSGSDQPATAPLLGPLADNGGPTFTHALLAGSPAIDMGSPAAPGSGGTACEATDQRGVARPDGSRCDVGAFEGVPIGTTSTTTSATTTTTLPFPLTCPLLPRGYCQPALGERSKLALKSVAADHARDKLSWSWVGSAPVQVADFADPVGGAADYALCLYDGTGFPRLRPLRAPAGGTCGQAPCWKATSSGFTYTDSLLDHRDGLKKIVLRPGAVAGKAKIMVKGRGGNLGLSLPLTAPVRAQLIHSDGVSTCWDAAFSTSIRNDGEIFSARSDP